MGNVSSILRGKGNVVWSVAPEATILEALNLMAEKGIGAVLVMKGQHLRGIFSERDYARRGVLKGRGVDAKIEEVMTAPVITVSKDSSLEECLVSMTEHHFRHLPVVEGEQVIGIISIGDVVKTVIDEQRNHISGLENYIMGR